MINLIVEAIRSRSSSDNYSQETSLSESKKGECFGSGSVYGVSFMGRTRVSFSTNKTDKKYCSYSQYKNVSGG